MDLQTLVNTIKVATQAAGIKITGSDKLNTVKDTGKTILTAKDINKLNSIAGKARSSIAQYPILVSENLNPKLVPIIANALEVEYSTLLMQAISNVSSFDSGDAGSVIGKFHNGADRMNEETFLCGVESKSSLYEANKKLLQPYEESFNMRSLNESYYTKSVVNYLEEKKKVSSDDINKDNNKRANDEYKYKKRQYDDQHEKHMKDMEKYASDKMNSEFDRNVKNVQNGIGMVSDIVNTGISISKEIDRKRDRAMSKKEFEDDQAQKNYNAGRAVVRTSIRDLAKINDMHPTILNLTVNFKEPETDSVVSKDLLIGVKCVSHLLKSEDIQYYLTKASYKNNGFLRLIKWTTGEIKFWKDLIFTLDDIKLSALQNSKTAGNKNYFSKLEYIAKTSKQAILTGAKTENVPAAITTLVITKTDVENIKYKDGINILSNPNYLKKICEAYYLLGLLIVDESLDVVYKYDQFSNSILTNPISSYEKTSKERIINANDLVKLVR